MTRQLAETIKNNKNTFPSRLKAVIGDQDVWLFTRQVGLSDREMASYLEGSMYPSFETLVEIAKFSKVSLDWLMTGQENGKEEHQANLHIKNIPQYLETFPERLAAIIEPIGKGEFLKRCGIADSVLRKYLHGTTYPGYESMLKIAAAGQVSVVWLLTGHGDRDTADEYLDKLAAELVTRIEKLLLQRKKG